MLNVFAIPRARMPVVKFEHPETGAREKQPLLAIGLEASVVYFVTNIW